MPVRTFPANVAAPEVRVNWYLAVEVEPLFQLMVTLSVAFVSGCLGARQRQCCGQVDRR